MSITQEQHKILSYLPEGYEQLKSAKNYLSLSKLPEGEHRLRIMQRPIAGWLEWHEKKPYRYRPGQKPDQSLNALDPMKPFWACYVWDYARNDLFVMEITQNTILKALSQLGHDADWGDFTTYDIKIFKEGSGLETKYHVAPSPHKPLTTQMVTALKKKPVKLEALYDGEDPWEMEGSPVSVPSVPTPSSYVPVIGVQKGKEIEELLQKCSAKYRVNFTAYLRHKVKGFEVLEDIPVSMYESVKELILQKIMEEDNHLAMSA